MLSVLACDIDKLSCLPTVQLDCELLDPVFPKLRVNDQVGFCDRPAKIRIVQALIPTPTSSTTLEVLWYCSNKYL